MRPPFLSVLVLMRPPVLRIVFFMRPPSYDLCPQPSRCELDTGVLVRKPQLVAHPSPPDCSMLSKRALPHDPQSVPASKRFRANAADLFLTNTVPARRAATLFADATAAGAQHVDDLAEVGRRPLQNRHRDLLRRLCRRSKWPSLYYAKVRVWNRKTQAEEVVCVPVLLPHEVMSVIAAHSDMGAFASTAGMTQAAREHLAAAATQMGTGPPVVGLGLWIDGTPCNWDRSESVETFAYSFPGLTGGMAALRLPFAVILHKHCIARHTFDDLLQVFVWSLEALVTGVAPCTKHNGEAWWRTDYMRQRRAGQTMPVRGLLLEIRGDWKCMAEVFRLPSWHERDMCCWKCTANHVTRRDCSLQAHWRRERLNHWDMMERWMRKGIEPCTIVGAPFFDVKLFVHDWLHVMDLGVTCDFLANLFHLLLPYKSGSNQKERVKSLYRDIDAYYRRTRAESRLDTLTVDMLGKRGQPPKLRARGAEARGLVDFAHEQAQALLGATPEEQTARQAAEHLRACYHNLCAEVFDHGSLKENSRKFCILYSALESTVPAESKRWRMKPKFHQMQELCEESTTNPASNWCYRDEDFGGSMSAFCRVRGGRATPQVIGRNVLMKFEARHPVPRV